ncbi:trihelix transcription factor ASR3-like isoform X1 [Gossypium australe]|uniref:Trihelix transcription factor ASR3-like isoform X1 n=1 Tax=Gossypium australe TaxID=47621 RepID=A0A5B6X8A8_9ROSI|nr:trihelix transcription factor ASR3-like isoform X1 [Gossypium australe]
MKLEMADQGGDNIVTREYRKGNWTVNETLVLIEAKKMDDERRMKRSGDIEGRGKPTELRWKWVEDYCWRKGCLRSQNQCNDKWDNLMRDYKKVREYQRRIPERGEGTHSNEGSSYWEMEKNERKVKNLPSNMLRLIYERLEEVVEKKGDQTAVAAGGSGLIPNIPYVMDRPITSVETSLPPLLQHQPLAPIPAAIPLTLPAPPQLPPPPIAAAAAAPQVQPPPLSYAQPLPTVGTLSLSLIATTLRVALDLLHNSDTSEYSDSPAKRRKRGTGNGEGSSGGTASANNSNEVGTAISKSASIIAEAIQASEEREERRHRDLVSLHETRIKMEESKTEMDKRGLDGLVDAINKLANSILALATHKKQSVPK